MLTFPESVYIMKYLNSAVFNLFILQSNDGVEQTLCPQQRGKKTSLPIAKWLNHIYNGIVLYEHIFTKISDHHIMNVQFKRILVFVENLYSLKIFVFRSCSIRWFFNSYKFYVWCMWTSYGWFWCLCQTLFLGK